MIEILTRKEARRIVREHVERGSYKPFMNTWRGAYMICPLCRERVMLDPLPFGQFEPFRKDWEVVLLRHLLSEYDDDRCVEVGEVK